MQKITTFLWFDNQAEEAMQFYVSVFKQGRILGMSRQGEQGAVISGTFELEGQQFMALNGGPYFSFTPAISLFVDCETQQEVDDLWEKLSEGGAKQKCGWLTDRFGLSWQIIPRALGQLLQDPDPARAERVRLAMLGMEKIDIEGLQRAHAGESPVG
ncbi:VOC family protein [Paenibacillus sp. J31TS4]|uniref:VOC family protein n=1 Tax=Paenibacillus sp. J31TS4 TaxID=2807195 RepID=UPI001B1C928F|nr:VOC family protein [Paenibacillus sp. J31TS4]GIP38158.1 VOC family protein [Paenibacillus sp. J31TS4]